MLQASQYPLDPFPLLTWFYQDHHHGGNSQKTSRESRGLLCAAASFIFFFLFFSSPQEIWRVGEKHKNHHIKHAALSCSPECLNQAPTRPQPFSNCTIMPYANNSYFLDKPVDPNALCKPSKKCTTKPTLKSKSKKEFTQQNEGRCGLLTANHCCTA